MKIQDYIKYWYSTYREPKNAMTTNFTVNTYIHNHIENSDFGNMEIEDIKVRDVQSFLTGLLVNGNKSPLFRNDGKNHPLAKSTVTKIRQIIIASMNQAIKEHIIIQNPAIDTEPIKLSYQRGAFFSADAQQKILEYTANHRFYTAYLLLFYTGCRRGEILGLSWDNVDLIQNYISIQQTLLTIGGKVYLFKNHAKTSGSIRFIPIPPNVKNKLIEVKERQEKEKAACLNWYNPNSLIFTNKDGSPHNPTYFTRNFKNVIRKLGLPQELHLHSTRHSWATNMVQLGIPLSDIQALGGWSRPDVLLKIYAHTLQNSQKIAINKLWEMFNDN